jgi:hypothetical protein
VDCRGIITVCIVGPKAPASIEHALDEGVTVLGGGDNI